MSNMLLLLVYTANILGSFNDPFEFEGDYGPEMNPTRKKVFELVVEREALAKHLTDEQLLVIMQNSQASSEDIKSFRAQLLSEAIEQDRNHGPTMGELIPPSFVEELIVKQQELHSANFTQEHLSAFIYFINRFSDQRIFRFLRNTHSGFLSLDKTLPDQASVMGKRFSLPILGSTQKLDGVRAFELKKKLLDELFTEETFSLGKSEEKLLASLEKMDDAFIKDLLGESATIQDLRQFCSPVGQTFMFWFYHALNLHLIADDPQLLLEVNKVKEIFAKTLGDAEARASQLRKNLVEVNASTVFSQESGSTFVREMTKDGLFHPVDLQNPTDGTFVLLRSDVWESNYDILSLEGYAGFQKGRLNAVLATLKGRGGKYLLASCHGNSTNPADGRYQISLLKEIYNELIAMPENSGLQLLIGIDANTKSEKDVEDLRSHLESLGLVATKSMGPTTVKKRMLTVQHSKAGKFAVDEEDFLITLKPENGGRFVFDHQTVGFSENEASGTRMLPDVGNPSDHYPVGVTLIPVMGARPGTHK